MSHLTLASNVSPSPEQPSLPTAEPPPNADEERRRRGVPTTVPSTQEESAAKREQAAQAKEIQTKVLSDLKSTLADKSVARRDRIQKIIDLLRQAAETDNEVKDASHDPSAKTNESLIEPQIQKVICEYYKSNGIEVTADQVRSFGEDFLTMTSPDASLTDRITSCKHIREQAVPPQDPGVPETMPSVTDAYLRLTQYELGITPGMGETVESVISKRIQELEKVQDHVKEFIRLYQSGSHIEAAMLLPQILELANVVAANNKDGASGYKDLVKEIGAQTNGAITLNWAELRGIEASYKALVAYNQQVKGSKDPSVLHDALKQATTHLEHRQQAVLAEQKNQIISPVEGQAEQRGINCFGRHFEQTYGIKNFETYRSGLELASRYVERREQLRQEQGKGNILTSATYCQRLMGDILPTIEQLQHAGNGAVVAEFRRIFRESNPREIDIVQDFQEGHSAPEGLAENLRRRSTRVFSGGSDPSIPDADTELKKVLHVLEPEGERALMTLTLARQFAASKDPSKRERAIELAIERNATRPDGTIDKELQANIKGAIEKICPEIQKVQVPTSGSKDLLPTGSERKSESSHTPGRGNSDTPQMGRQQLNDIAAQRVFEQARQRYVSSGFNPMVLNDLENVPTVQAAAGGAAHAAAIQRAYTDFADYCGMFGKPPIEAALEQGLPGARNVVGGKLYSPSVLNEANKLIEAAGQAAATRNSQLIDDALARVDALGVDSELRTYIYETARQMDAEVLLQSGSGNPTMGRAISISRRLEEISNDPEGIKSDVLAKFLEEQGRIDPAAVRLGHSFFNIAFERRGMGDFASFLAKTPELVNDPNIMEVRRLLYPVPGRSTVMLEPRKSVFVDRPPSQGLSDAQKLARRFIIDWSDSCELAPLPKDMKPRNVENAMRASHRSFLEKDLNKGFKSAQERHEFIQTVTDETGLQPVDYMTRQLRNEGYADRDIASICDRWLKQIYGQAVYEEAKRGKIAVDAVHGRQAAGMSPRTAAVEGLLSRMSTQQNSLLLRAVDDGNAERGQSVAGALAPVNETSKQHEYWVEARKLADTFKQILDDPNLTDEQKGEAIDRAVASLRDPDAERRALLFLYQETGIVFQYSSTAKQ